jgi:hypothetical protein
MLALKDYGSSDENSEPENEKVNDKVETRVKSSDRNDDFIAKAISVNKLTAPFNLQICSAPEVVPTVCEFVLKDCFDMRD